MFKHLHKLLLFLVVSFPFQANADWINLSGAENSRNIAEIYVNEDHVKLKLEIFIDDLKIFHDLVPDQLLISPQSDRTSQHERLTRFAQETFQILDDGGVRLPARLNIAEPRLRIKRPSPLVGMINPYTRQPIPGPPKDKRVLYAELIYPFQERPSSLTFIPPTDKNGFPIASIGFVCFHQGVTVVDFRMLGGRSTLSLNWEDPWYSSFDKKQYQRRLQSGIRTYLYIEPYEVRHEILVRIKDMMSWIDFELRGDEFIEEDEFDPVRQKVASFFLDREKVFIDGQRLKPILDRTAYVESTMQRSRFIEIPERVPLNTAMVGVIITYLTDGIPQNVETQWDLFSERLQKVTGSMIDPAGPFPYDLEPEDNILRWDNYLTNYKIPTIEHINIADHHRGLQIPLISLVCLLTTIPMGYFAIVRVGTRRSKLPYLTLAGVIAIGAIVAYPFARISVGGSAIASQITEEDAANLIHSLMKNVYRAFDFREEEDVYDKLAVSVTGDLLTDIYLQSRKSLQIEQAGGAQAKVEEVEVLEAVAQESVRQNGAIDIRTKWSATGTVGHWGHIHTRKNVYEALLTVAPVDEAWKISSIEVLDEMRVDPFKVKPE